MHKFGDALAQVEVAFGSRVIGEVLAVRFNNGRFHFGRYGKNSRIKIANSKVVNGFALADAFADFAAQFYNFRTDQCFGKMRKFHLFFLRRAKRDDG